LRTNNDSYRVFVNSPATGAQQDVPGPAPYTASPSGWLGSSTTTIGNNVDAYLDRDNNNAADASGRPTAPDQNFLFPWDGAQAPTTAANQLASVTNLFYLNNVLHDRLYGYGFTESAGNFQQNNFDRGGAGGDPVNAEAQDGGGTNNANFSTPTDGSRPRMQMYLWTSATPSRDGDLDSDIVYHEYGHGLTWRMIGSMTGPLAGAIGEGMSDTLATYFNGDDAVAEYSYNKATGIRRFKYTDYPYTYKNVTGSSVHNDGEIYGAAMWRLRQIWLTSTRDHDRLLTFIVDGMNYTPSRPDYEAMRDGILSAMNADAASTGERCAVWDAFAKYGIGVGADGRETCRIFTCSVTITESFAKPAECTGGTNTAPVVTIASPTNNASFVQGAAVSFTGSADDAESGDLTSGLTWTSSIAGQIGTGASFSRSDLAVGTHVVTASVTDGGGLTGTRQVTITVSAATGFTLTTRGYKVKGVRTVDLSWSGATGDTVDVYRDNTQILASTPNDGTQTDTIAGKGSGTFTYRVCNAGTATCSNPSAVTF
jgi:extracellular elastinolytic metalloproteinase